jgi:hypothetical protein
MVKSLNIVSFVERRGGVIECVHHDQSTPSGPGGADDGANGGDEQLWAQCLAVEVRGERQLGQHDCRDLARGTSSDLYGPPHPFMPRFERAKNTPHRSDSPASSAVPYRMSKPSS